MHNITFPFLEPTNTTQTLISELFKSFDSFLCSTSFPEYLPPYVSCIFLLKFFKEQQTAREGDCFFLWLKFLHLHKLLLGLWWGDHSEKEEACFHCKPVWGLMGTTLSTWISELSEKISLALGRHSQNQRIVKSFDLEKTFRTLQGNWWLPQKVQHCLKVSPDGALNTCVIVTAKWWF